MRSHPAGRRRACLDLMQGPRQESPFRQYGIDLGQAQKHPVATGTLGRMGTLKPPDLFAQTGKQWRWNVPWGNDRHRPLYSQAVEGNVLYLFYSSRRRESTTVPLAQGLLSDMPMFPRLSALAALAATACLLAGPALARCSKNLVERTIPGLHFASLDGTEMAAGDSPNRAVITFLGHASYQIDTPQGVRAITDYNGLNGFGRHPDIVTMNNAHSTHFTDVPEDGITYVLRGWPSKPGETEAKHDVTLKDMRVWNVPTNARAWYGGENRINGNSIFIFAIGDLCIAHLGHLHHRLTRDHLDELGRIDVLMVPIDGSFTMGQPLMADVIQQIQPSIVLPMHYWGRSQLERFMGLLASQEPAFIVPDKQVIEVAKEELPQKLTVIAVGGDGGD
jgi:Beta-lactamase superfamily domain